MQREMLYNLHRKTYFDCVQNLDVKYYSLEVTSKIGRTQFLCFLRTKSTQLKSVLRCRL